MKLVAMLVAIGVLSAGLTTPLWAADSCACDAQWKLGLVQCNAGSCASGSCTQGGTWAQGHAGTFWCGCVSPGEGKAPEPDYCHGKLTRDDEGFITNIACLGTCTTLGCNQGPSQCADTSWTECICQ